MSFKTLSKILHAERGSKSIKFAEAVVIEYSDKLFNEIIKELDDIRESAWPDKGFSLNFTETTRINNGGMKLFLKIIDYVIKNNNLNMDIWVSSKMSKDLKLLIDDIKDRISKKGSRSIRIREGRKKKVDRFILLNWLAGLVFVLLGSTNLFRDQSIKTTWIEGSNMIQLIGGLMVFASLAKYLRDWQLNKKSNREDD